VQCGSLDIDIKLLTHNLEIEFQVFDNENLIDSFHCFMFCRYVQETKQAETQKGDNDQAWMQGEDGYTPCY